MLNRKAVLAAVAALALAAAGVAAAAAVTNPQSFRTLAASSSSGTVTLHKTKLGKVLATRLGHDALSLQGGQAREERLLRPVRHVLAAAHEEGGAHRRHGPQGEAAGHHEAQERNAPGDIRRPSALPVQARQARGRGRGPGSGLLRRQVVRAFGRWSDGHQDVRPRRRPTSTTTTTAPTTTCAYGGC